MTQGLTIDNFGGLNLIADPQDVGMAGAVDLLNVSFDKPGRIRTRDGWSLLGSGAAGSDITSLGFYSTSGGTEYIIASDSTTLRPYQHDGTAGTTQAGSAGSNNAYARFGDPSNTRLYVTAGGNLFRFTGSWTSIGGLPIAPNLCAVTANDNRLVIATGSADAKVHFSDAGAPETFGASNYVTLWPGDGEGITALIRWRDRLFAFKRTKFAVFTNASIDATGNPIFNYYGVDTGHGALLAGAAVVGDEGVYFADQDGVWLTTGDAPRYVSRPLEPWYRTRSFGSLPSLAGNPQLAYARGRLYVNWPSAGVQAVYDPQLDAWAVWQISTAVAMLGVVGVSLFESGLYIGDSTTDKIGLVSSSSATDNGTTIPWRYQSGWYDLGAPFREKNLRNSWVTGVGNVTLTRYRDYATSDANAGSLSLVDGSGNAVTGAHLKSWRGTLMSHKLSGSGAAEVVALGHEVRSVRPAGVRTAVS